MNARESFDLLCREIGRVFPPASREAELLVRPLAELARMLESDVEAAEAEAGPALDGLEDLLEALMHQAGWPEPSGAGERGRTW